MNGFKRLYQLKLPPNLVAALPALLQLLNKLYPGRWTFKVSWQVNGKGQIVLAAELKLGKSKR